MTVMTRRIAALAAAGLLALASVALAARSGTYAGTTSQKLNGRADRISLKVGSGAITKVGSAGARLAIG